MSEISNYDDTIGSRDVISRIAELESLRDDLASARAELAQAQADLAKATQDGGVDPLDIFQEMVDRKQGLVELAEIGFDDFESDELDALTALQSEAENCGDWQHGAQLIRESYFETYAQELAADMHGNGVHNMHWPFCHIDWTAAADSLKNDYSTVYFDGVEYLIRS